METGTDTVPNTPPTAASAGSDLNGSYKHHKCYHIVLISTLSMSSTVLVIPMSLVSQSGMAVLEGCRVINSRLEKFKKENPGGTWEDWVTAAFFARSSLFHMVTMMKNQMLIKMLKAGYHVNGGNVSMMIMVSKTTMVIPG